MKNLFGLFSLIFLTYHSVAQVPQAFSFQSIVLDSNGEPISDQLIGVKVDILDNSLTGDIVYSETHQSTTNMSGIYSINIGQGTAIQGTFAQIPWSNGNKYISLSQDVSGGSNYIFAGASQLLSVPYALVAGSAKVKPIIYVRGLIGNTDNVLDNEDPDARANFRTTYQWIQGTPEDIFVSYNNLPPNTHLYMYSELGNVEVEDFDNFTAKDTIFDGIRFRSNRLVRTDPNVPIPAGNYDVEITYSSADELLATVIHPFTVIDGEPNNPNCLTPEDAGVYTLTSNNCTDIEDYFLDEITLEATGSGDLLRTKVLTIQETFIEFTHFDINGTCFYEVQGEYYYEDSEIRIEGFVDRVESTAEEFVITIDLQIEDLITETTQPYNCELRYDR